MTTETSKGMTFNVCSSVLEAFQRVHDEAFEEGRKAGLIAALQNPRVLQIAAMGLRYYPVEDLQLAVRTYNALVRAEIRTLAQLLMVPKAQLLTILGGNIEWFEQVNDAAQKHSGMSLIKD